MSGTIEGGRKAAKTNLERYGKDFYKINGAKGGRNGHTGGFASNRELARVAGAKGGRISRRGDNKESLEERRKKEAQITNKKGFFKRILGVDNG